jgi:uncharacterized membrane protein YccC
MEARTMQKDDNNNKSEKQESQAERLLAKAEEQRQKLENATTEEEAEAILQILAEIEKEIEEATKQTEEKHGKALQEYKEADIKVKKLISEAEALVRAIKDAKATTTAVLQAIESLQNAFYDVCQKQMSNDIADIKEQMAKEFASVKSKMNQIANDKEAEKQWKEQTGKEMLKIKILVYIAVAIGVLSWIMK